MNNSGTSGSICAETEPPKPLTLGGLVHAYETNKASGFHKQRYHARLNAGRVLARLTRERGETPLTDIRAATIQVWYDEWATGGKIATAHSFMAKLRTLFGFGLLMLEDRECERLSVVMSKLKFQQGQPRVAWLTAAQADAVRATAREHFGWDSIALAQAFQFEVMLRQKDVIGEWVPESEPGESDVRWHGEKWLCGIRWEEIDDNWILRHKTSKRQKVIEVDLKQAPMVLEELRHIANRPLTGPIILNELTGYPWSGNEFRRKWRLVADKAGLPKEVRNQDSRAGGITEATEAGADIEHVKHAATHSDISQTQRYSRNATDKIASVQAKRLQHRYRTAG